MLGAGLPLLPPRDGAGAAPTQPSCFLRSSEARLSPPQHPPETLSEQGRALQKLPPCLLPARRGCSRPFSGSAGLGCLLRSQAKACSETTAGVSAARDPAGGGTGDSLRLWLYEKCLISRPWRAMSDPPLPVGCGCASPSTPAGSEAPPGGLFLAQSVSLGGSPHPILLHRASRACQHCLLNPHSPKSQSSSSLGWHPAGAGHTLTALSHPLPPSPPSPGGLFPNRSPS